MPADDSSESDDEPAAKKPSVSVSRGWDGVKVNYCLQCGRFRSRRFHLANPLMPGQKRLWGVCSRCKKEPRRTPFGNRSGKIVGERIIITAYSSMRNRHHDKQDQRQSNKQPERARRPKASSRIEELSDSSSSDGQQVDEYMHDKQNRKVQTSESKW